MARARNIKPGFFLNDELVELRYEWRLLFIGLWTLADREGRLEDRPKKIKMSLFPADEIDINQGLSDLGAKGFVLRYEVDNNHYIQIVNFLKHQKPHHQEVPSVIPEPDLSGLGAKGFACNRPDSLNLIPDSLNLIPEENTLVTQDEKNIQKDRIPVQKIVDLYHAMLPELPRVQKLTQARKSQIAQRWREDIGEIHKWENFFKHVKRSDFLMGRGQPTNGRKVFIADLEWLTKAGNFAKIAEDKYHG